MCHGSPSPRSSRAGVRSSGVAVPEVISCRTLLAASVGVLLAVGAAPAFAQGVPAAAGAASREAEASRATAPVPKARAEPVLPQLVEPQLTFDAGQKILVRTVVLDGEQPLGEADAREIVAAYEGRRLSLADIYEMAGKVTNLYRAKGCLVAKTYVPAQNAKSGTLHLKLVVGRFGDVKIDNQSLVSDERVKATIDAAVGDRPYIHQDGIERAMLLVDDLAGAKLPKATISAGAVPGASDFSFAVPTGKRFGGYFMGDTWGAPSTGRERLSGDIFVNSPLGLGDRLDLYGLASRDSGLLNGRASYALPLWAAGPRAEIAAFSTTYALGGAYGALDAKGVAQGASGTLSYALQRSRASSLYLSVNGTYKHLRDEVLSTTTSERDITLATFAVTRETAGDLFGLPLQTSTTGSVTAGHVAFVGSVPTTDAQGDYGRANAVFTATLGLIENLALTTTAKAQASFGKTLDSSEQFGIAGAWGVRSFDEGLSGDSGFLVTPELRYQLPQVWEIKHALGVFTDYGVAWLAHPDPTGLQRSRVSLQDVGLGYYANWDWSEGRTLFLKAHLGRTVGPTTGAERYDQTTKALIQVGTTF